MYSVMSKALSSLARSGLTRPLSLVRECHFSTKPKSNPINCACAGHPWPERKVELTIMKKNDCEFNFKKLEVHPFDPPCDCQDPPPPADCAGIGKHKEVCCRSIRQYGCFCEEEEEECDAEEEDVVVQKKSCDLDFKKLEVNPYDPPCDCHDPPATAACADLPRQDVCCRTPRPFGCLCETYEQPGLDCLKQKAPVAPKKAKECKKKKLGAKCL